MSGKRSPTADGADELSFCDKAVCMFFYSWCSAVSHCVRVLISTPVCPLGEAYKITYYYGLSQINFACCTSLVPRPSTVRLLLARLFPFNGRVEGLGTRLLLCLTSLILRRRRLVTYGDCVVQAYDLRLDVVWRSLTRLDVGVRTYVASLTL